MDTKTQSPQAVVPTQRWMSCSAPENPIRRLLGVCGYHQKFFPDKATRRPILQVIQHGLVGLSHRASQPIHLKRPHRVCGASTANFQLSRLVKKANANPRRELLLLETNRTTRNSGGGLLCAAAQRLGFDGIRGLFCQSTWSLHRSELLRRSRATHSVDL